MYRLWYSTESFADFIIDNTNLVADKDIQKRKLFESDAKNPHDFHKMPDHIRKILYLDAPDLIIEFDNEPILSIEISTEAGTGHNAFQRFARLAAAVENGVPAFYIYPEAAIIKRQNSPYKWDVLNPLVLSALESVMQLYNIPAFIFYYPSDYNLFKDNASSAAHLSNKGLICSEQIKYSGCPSERDDSMLKMFDLINSLLTSVEKSGVTGGLNKILKKTDFRSFRDNMSREFGLKSEGRQQNDMSPLTAVQKIDTEKLLSYLNRYEDSDYSIGELLHKRRETLLYQVNAKFRGDPYPGALAAIDYLACRNGRTFEDRDYNLVLVFGKIVFSEDGSFKIIDEKGSTINDFSDSVKNAERHNLLTKDYCDLKKEEIPRYFMQVRYGSTYSKNKHIRVYSYFADAVLFPDGALWRDA